MQGGASANRGPMSYPPVCRWAGVARDAAMPPRSAQGNTFMHKLKLIAVITLTGLGQAIGAMAAGAQALPGGFVFLRDIDPSIIQDIRYAGPNNFVGRPLRGYDAAECVVKREVGLRLRSVQQELA